MPKAGFTRCSNYSFFSLCCMSGNLCLPQLESEEGLELISQRREEDTDLYPFSAWGLAWGSWSVPGDSDDPFCVSLVAGTQLVRVGHRAPDCQEFRKCHLFAPVLWLTLYFSGWGCSSVTGDLSRITRP